MWEVGEIDLNNDKFESLNEDEQHYIKMVLAFFAASDGIVNENLAINMSNSVEYIEAEFFYKVTDYWNKEDERCLRWDDPDLNIDLPIQPTLISADDQKGKLFKDAEYFA